MKFNFRYFVTAVSMLACAFCGTSCNDDDDDNGGPANAPAVTLADADAATESSLSFVITPSNAEICAYICQEADKEAPSAADIVARGRSVSVESATTAKARNLQPNTDYTIYAAASMGQAYSSVARLTLTTLEHQVVPSVAVVKGAITDSSAVFTVTPTDAEKCAYVVVKKGETVPEAAAILADGTETAADKASEVTVKGLAENTEYVFAVAVSHGEQTGEVSETAFTTAEKGKTPTVAVEAFVLTNEQAEVTAWENFIFTVNLKDAVSAKYYLNETEIIEEAVQSGEFTYESIATQYGQDMTAERLQKALSEDGLTLVYSGMDPEQSYTVVIVATGNKGATAEAHSSATTEAEPLPTPVQSELYAKLAGNWTMTATNDEGNAVEYNVTIAGENSGVSYQDRNQLVVSGPIIFQNFYSIKDLMNEAGWSKGKSTKNWGPKFFLQIAQGDNVTVPADRNQYFLNWNASKIGEVYLLGYNDNSIRYADGSAFPVTVSADFNTITIKGYTADGKEYLPGVFNYLNSQWGFFEMYTSDIVLTRGTSNAVSIQSAAPAYDLPKFDKRMAIENNFEAAELGQHKSKTIVAPFIAK